MKKKCKRLIKRKVVDGKNVEFRVKTKIKGILNYHIDIDYESSSTIIKNIESGEYIYYLRNTHKIVEVINGELKSIGWAQANESKVDYINTLPIYSDND